MAFVQVTVKMIEAVFHCTSTCLRSLYMLREYLYKSGKYYYDTAKVE